MKQFIKHQEITISGNVGVLSSEHSARVSTGTGSRTNLKVPNMHGENEGQRRQITRFFYHCFHTKR